MLTLIPINRHAYMNHTLLHFLLVILLSIRFHTNGQVQVEGIVIDSETEEVIPYVNIGVIELGKGTVSDTLGQFSFHIEDEDVLITASAIGYETENITFSKLEESGNIFLQPVSYKLEAVTISSSKLNGEPKQYGVTNKNRGQSISFGNAQLGAAIGAVIEISQPTYIKSANFPINHANGDSMTFRVNILEFKKNKIGKHILTENIIIKAKQAKGHLTVDLSHLDLVLESDVLLSLEWVRDDDGKGNQGITFDTKKGGKYKGIYIKNHSMDDYEKLEHLAKKSPCFYFMGRAAE